MGEAAISVGADDDSLAIGATISARMAKIASVRILMFFALFVCAKCACARFLASLYCDAEICGAFVRFTLLLSRSCAARITICSRARLPHFFQLALARARARAPAAAAAGAAAAADAKL